MALAAPSPQRDRSCRSLLGFCIPQPRAPPLLLLPSSPSLLLARLCPAANSDSLFSLRPRLRSSGSPGPTPDSPKSLCLQWVRPCPAPSIAPDSRPSIAPPPIAECVPWQSASKDPSPSKAAGSPSPHLQRKDAGRSPL